MEKTRFISRGAGIGICALVASLFGGAEAAEVLVSKAQANYDYLLGPPGWTISGNRHEEREMSTVGVTLTHQQSFTWPGFITSVDATVQAHNRITEDYDHRHLMISAAGYISLHSTSTGTGLAILNAANPGTATETQFRLTSKSTYSLRGHFFTSADHPDDMVVLERFNGTGYETVFTRDGLEDPDLFESNGTLTAGLYRMRGQSGSRVEGNDFRESDYDYTLEVASMPVPEPGTTTAFVASGFILLRRRKRATV